MDFQEISRQQKSHWNKKWSKITKLLPETDYAKEAYNFVEGGTKHFWT